MGRIGEVIAGTIGTVIVTTNSIFGQTQNLMSSLSSGNFNTIGESNILSIDTVELAPSASVDVSGLLSDLSQLAATPDNANILGVSNILNVATVESVPSESVDISGFLSELSDFVETAVEDSDEIEETKEDIETGRGVENNAMTKGAGSPPPDYHIFGSQKWSELTDSEKIAHLQAVEYQMASDCGRKPRHVKIDFVHSSGGGYVSDGKGGGTIFIGCADLDENGFECLDTVLHEGRHAYQDDVVNNRVSHSETRETVTAWSQNDIFSGIYKRPETNYYEYRFQPREADAYRFAANLIDHLDSEIRNDSNYISYRENRMLNDQFAEKEGNRALGTTNASDLEKAVRIRIEQQYLNERQNDNQHVNKSRSKSFRDLMAVGFTPIHRPSNQSVNPNAYPEDSSKGQRELTNEKGRTLSNDDDSVRKAAVNQLFSAVNQSKMNSKKLIRKKQQANHLRDNNSGGNTMATLAVILTEEEQEKILREYKKAIEEAVGVYVQLAAKLSEKSKKYQYIPYRNAVNILISFFNISLSGIIGNDFDEWRNGIASIKKLLERIGNDTEEALANAQTFENKLYETQKEIIHSHPIEGLNHSTANPNFKIPELQEDVTTAEQACTQIESTKQQARTVFEQGAEENSVYQSVISYIEMSLDDLVVGITNTKEMISNTYGGTVTRTTEVVNAGTQADDEAKNRQSKIDKFDVDVFNGNSGLV